MKKKIILCLLLIIVIILAYFYSHIDKNSYIYERSADTTTFYGTGILEDGEEIRQTFITEENTIDGINIKVMTVGNSEDVFLCYALLDEDNVKKFEGTISLSQLKSNKFNKLEISDIVETKGKDFTLVLSTQNSDPQNGIGFYIEPTHKQGQKLIIGGEETDGTLVTRIICHRFDMETFVVVLGMLVFIAVFMKALFKLFK